MTWEASTDPVKNEQAIAWFRKRVPVTPEAWAFMTGTARRQAFKVAGVAQLDIVAQVHAAALAAIDAGTTLADFKKAIGPKLIGAWAGTVADPPARLETIFRTNVQLGYAAGRYRQMSDPAVKKFRPYFMLDTTGDARQSSICRALSNPRIVLLQDDPFWETHTPPLHFRCRSGLRALRRSQATAQGITSEPPDVPPTPGFGGVPGATEWEPDLKKYPPSLKAEFKKKPEPPPAPEPPKPAPEPEPAPAAKPKKPNPQHKPEYWLKEYAHLEEAAPTVAHGRAAMERGLDAPVDSALRSLSDGPSWMKYQVRETNQLLERAKRGSSKDIATLRDLIEEIESRPKEFTAHDVRRARAAAALSGHVDSITPQPVKLKPAKKEPAAAKVLREEAEALYSKLMSKDVMGDLGNQVSIKFAGGNRAFYDHAKLMIQSNSSPGVSEHEFGHVMEYMSPGRLRQAIRFRSARTKGDHLEQLSDLRPRERFEIWEVTRKDKFRHPYIGKLYAKNGDDYATEITSMGVEALVKEGPTFLAEDPEHFFFVLGQLANQ